MKENRRDQLVDVQSHPYSLPPEKFDFNLNRLHTYFVECHIWEGAILGGKKGPVYENGIE